jgi:hypothetical protein
MRDEKGTIHFVIERPSARMLEAVLRIPVAMGKSDIPFGSVNRSKAMS